MNKTFLTISLATLLLDTQLALAADPLSINGSTTTPGGGVTFIPKPVAQVSAANAFASLAVDDNEGNPAITVDLITNGTIGTVLLNGGLNGRYGYIAGITDKYAATYRLDSTNPAVRALSDGQTLTDTIAYTVTSKDDQRITAPGLLTVTVLAPKIKPVAYDDTATVAVDPTKLEAVVSLNVKANDINAGVVDLMGSPVGKYGFLDQGTNPIAGEYTYKVDLNNAAVKALRSGDRLTETFTYRVRAPGNSQAYDMGNITITLIGSTATVAEVRAVNDTASLIIDSATANPTVTLNVLGNDVNVDKAALTGSSVGRYGSLDGGISGAGSLTYRVNLNNPAVQQMLSSSGASLSDSFTYVANGLSPNERVTSQATITINLVAGNIVPFKAFDITESIKAEEATATTTAGTPTPAATEAGTVKGNLKDYNVGLLKLNDTNLRSEILSSQFGKYGYLQFSSSTNAFIYTLNTGVSEVQALRNSGNALQDVFRYRITDRYNVSAEANIVINIVSNREYVSTDNVEIENNNRSSLATPLNSGAYMRGNLMNSSDRDWYVINSSGNEIINFELCPQGFACSAQNAWVMYVFDADKFTSKIEDTKIDLYRSRDDGGSADPYDSKGIYPKVIGSSDHLYLLYRTGVFGNGGAEDPLLGVIDPCYGTKHSVDISAATLPPGKTKNYLVAISSPLQHDGAADANKPCGSGTVVLKKPGPVLKENTASATTTNTVGNNSTTTTSTTRDVSTTDQYISILNSDDQYTFKVTRSGVSPAVAKSSKDDAVYDPATGSVQIPKVRVDLEQYFVQLRQKSAKSANGVMSFDIAGLQALNEPLAANPLLGTYNPQTQDVILPKVLIKGTDNAYSVTLKYRPQTNDLQFFGATPLK